MREHTIQERVFVRSQRLQSGDSASQAYADDGRSGAASGTALDAVNFQSINLIRNGVFIINDAFRDEFHDSYWQIR